MTGTVYTETLIHSAPEAFVSEAPYQVIIVTLENGTRITGRVSGDSVSIDDVVVLADERDGVPFFRKISQ
jgi:uncharacterized OB-fold protein